MLTGTAVFGTADGKCSAEDVVDVVGDGGALLWPISSTGVWTEAVCSAAAVADDSVNSSLRNCHKWMCCDDDVVVGVVAVLAVLAVDGTATVFPARVAADGFIAAVVEVVGWSESESCREEKQNKVIKIMKIECNKMITQMRT